MKKFEFVIEVDAEDQDQAEGVMASIQIEVPLGVTVSCDYLGELVPPE